MQFTHADDPEMFLWVPRLQPEQLSPLAPVNPGTQLQFISDGLPAKDDEALGHCMQVDISTAETISE